MQRERDKSKQIGRRKHSRDQPAPHCSSQSNLVRHRATPDSARLHSAPFDASGAGAPHPPRSASSRPLSSSCKKKTNDSSIPDETPRIARNRAHNPRQALSCPCRGKSAHALHARSRPPAPSSSARPPVPKPAREAARAGKRSWTRDHRNAPDARDAQPRKRSALRRRQSRHTAPPLSRQHVHPPSPSPGRNGDRPTIPPLPSPTPLPEIDPVPPTSGHTHPGRPAPTPIFPGPAPPHRQEPEQGAEGVALDRPPHGDGRASHCFSPKQVDVTRVTAACGQRPHVGLRKSVPHRRDARGLGRAVAQETGPVPLRLAGRRAGARPAHSRGRRRARLPTAAPSPTKRSVPTPILKRRVARPPHAQTPSRAPSPHTPRLGPLAERAARKTRAPQVRPGRVPCQWVMASRALRSARKNSHGSDGQVAA